MLDLKFRFLPRGSRILPCWKLGDVSVKGVDLSNIWLVSGVFGDNAGNVGTLFGFRRSDFDCADKGETS